MGAATKQYAGSDLLGVFEIASLFKVSDTAVWQWRTKSKYKFPKPVVGLHCGPVYSRKEVLAWGKNRV
jgi:hypothetical protein